MFPPTLKSSSKRCGAVDDPVCDLHFDQLDERIVSDKTLGLVATLICSMAHLLKGIMHFLQGLNGC